MNQAPFMTGFLDVLPALRVHGFVEARGTQVSERTAFVARPLEDVCLYVFGAPSRTWAGADAWLWVAPPDLPSDALGSLRVGFKIELGGKMDGEAAPDYLAFLARRVSAMLPALPALYPLVLQELHDSFPTPRRSRYVEERKVARWFRAYAGSPQGAPLAAPLLAAMSKVAKQGRGIKATSALAVETLDRLRQIPEAWKELERCFGDILPITGKSDGLMRILYIDALTPWPPVRASSGKET